MSKLIERLGDMPVVTVEQVIRFRESVFDELERLTKENEEVMRQKAYQYQRAKKAEEELAALKAQSTEPVAVIKRNESGQITMQAPDGNHFDMSKYVGATLYTTPPTTTALLGSLGDWVYERMQQADSDYHNYGDDTAEVYATLKMVLSKIESMMIESLPLIEGEK